MTDGSLPAYDQVVAELSQLREQGWNSIRKRSYPVLHEAARQVLPRPVEMPDQAAVEQLLRLAIERFDGGPFQDAADYTFALARGTKLSSAFERRKKAAAVLKLNTETFRKDQERVIVEQVAEYIVAVCRERKHEARRFAKFLTDRNFIARIRLWLRSPFRKAVAASVTIIAVISSMITILSSLGVIPQVWNTNFWHQDSSPTCAAAPDPQKPNTVEPNDVPIEAVLSVKNKTRHDADFASETNASVGDELEFRLYYYNRAETLSGNNANDLCVRVFPSQTFDPNQIIRAQVWGSNTNSVNTWATINTPARFDIVRLNSGSARWTHNTADNDNYTPKIATMPLSNDDILNEGYWLENARPCLGCEAEVHVDGRVEVS